MSRTFRRKNYEKSKRSKVHGSKISGLGIYAQVRYIRYEHPYLKQKVFVKNTFGMYECVTIEKPVIVSFPIYGFFDKKEYHKSYWKVHSDNAYGDRFNANRLFSRKYNKVLKNNYKEYICNFIKYGEEKAIFNPKIRGKNANYDCT